MKNTSRKPYIYKVTNLETGQYYIGSQCSGKIVGMNYFTSSTNKAFKEGFKTYREEKYKIEIVREFEDPEKCVRVENYIIRNYMLKRDGLCLNRFYCCNGKKVFSAVGIRHAPWNKGMPLSEETRKKISRTLKGTHPSEETRKKMCIAKEEHPVWNKGVPWSEEIRQKLCIAHKRIKISIEGTFFNSLNEASKYYNVGRATIKCWVKKNQHNAFYIKK